jgi:hypothetical protein
MDGLADTTRRAPMRSLRAWRMVAALLDTLLALAVAASGVAAAMAIVVTLAEARVMPYLTAVSEVAAAVLFWGLDLLVLTHVGAVAPATAGGVTLLCLLSRQGILPRVSPGAMLLRSVYRSARG